MTRYMTVAGVRHEVNPFLEGMLVPVRKKNVQVSRMGKDQNVLVNSGTGESYGTHVTTYKKVDAAKFVKVFTTNIALAFNLTPAGIKALTVLMWAVQNTAINKDLVLLDKYCLDGFVEAHQDEDPPLRLSHPTYLRGLADLEKASIIAKNTRRGWYYINPNFVFSGDRIAFTQVIELAKENEKIEAED